MSHRRSVPTAVGGSTPIHGITHTGNTQGAATHRTARPLLETLTHHKKKDKSMREVDCALGKKFGEKTKTGFPPGGTGVYFGTPQYFPGKIWIFTGIRGVPKYTPRKMVLEVVDDPLWSCDPTVQSVWLAVSKEVEEKGGKI